MRRDLRLDDLKQAVEEAERLLNSGYSKTGNWTLGQMCCHLRLTIEKNMDGYPRWMVMLGFPLRPILRRLALPKLLAFDSPAGFRTAGMFVPAADVDDKREVERFEQCVAAFLASKEALHSHPGFGRMSKGEFDRFHAAHAAHHFSFLYPHEADE